MCHNLQVTPGVMMAYSSGTLLDSLIHVSHEVSSMEKLPWIQVRNVSTIIRRVKLLSSLFEEIQETNSPLPPSSILCLTELFSLSLMSIGADVKEQVELLHKQAKRVDLFVDLDYEEEISKLEAESQIQAGTGGLIAVSKINNLISLVSHSKPLIFPDEFRCPISLDLMRDPVIVASGQTYDRSSIAQWINSGHYTCPKSGQKLIHMALVPNYALKSLVHQWCQENNVPLVESSSSSSLGSLLERNDRRREASENAVDHISAAKASVDAIRMTAEFLVGKLAMGSPFLVTLLSSTDPRIQENAVTALLNISIFENNKILIIAAGAIDSIVSVLENGRTMEARENAAATIYSLSMIDENKVVIGARPRAIPALVMLLKEGTALLIELLLDDKAGITDDALMILALLLGCPEGLEAIKKSQVLIPLLIDLLRLGSAKGKDNSITLLLGLCKDGGKEVAKRLLINPQSMPSLQSLSADGSMKARRKADALLRLLNRSCSCPCSNSRTLRDSRRSIYLHLIQREACKTNSFIACSFT